MPLSRDQFSCSAGRADCGPDAAPVDAKLSKQCPILEEFIRSATWDDDTPRVTGSLLIFAEDGRWKVMLNDRDADQIAFISGDSLDAAFKAAEKGLANQSLDWRVSKKKGGKGR